MTRRFSNSDETLIRRLQESDKEAFELVFNQFKEKLYYFAFGYLHSSSESEEIIQNVFVALWENRDLLNDAYPIRHYLYRITVNHIYNFFKHQSVKQRYAEHLVFEQSIEDDYDEQLLMANDLEEIVDTLVEELPVRQQLIYRLSRKEGLCHAEIADQLGLSIRSVENQIYRALKYIREKLRQESLIAE
ncbi:MAG TPA: RNA polymerase sigma-70 factor [Bacteroidales bacterium]|nr:RNA polymerase sigma-70 factor [Bacteroidales bacterium]